MTITFHVEKFEDRLEELKTILPRHWEELALDKDKVPLDPQYDVYIDREKKGGLIFIVGRLNGEMVAYFIGFVGPGIHYKTCLTCTMDIFYVTPEHRGRMGGIRLFKFVKAELIRRGVQRWIVGSKAHKDASRLFEALGMELIETYYSQWLGG